jgi:tetratricopeptide (TPR) repeat protein
MNRSDFLKMIESSGPADRQTISEVNELINIFPYFQSAYSLLLKGLQNTSDVKFENQLRVSAMHIANREVLYYLLRKEVLPEVKAELSVTPPAQTEGISADSQQTVIESGKNSTDLINEIEKKSIGDQGNWNAKDHSVLIADDSGDDDSNATILLIDDESGDFDEKVTYMDPGFSVREKTDLLELDQNESVSAEIHGDENAAESQVQDGTSSVKELQSALIDKFIEANPRIEPSREKPDKPNEDISKLFKEDGEGLVTETLARIYIRQGYYSKAIDIYEKLCLKFPEKSSYFASQIEKVKELIKK